MDNIGNKIGLALSGGGYRAAAYHVGTLRALRYLGLLDKVDVISSVSGGSIVAAYYLLHKENFRTFLKDFNKKIHIGVMHLAYTNVFLFVSAFIAIGYVFGWAWSLLIIPAFWFLNFKLLPLSVWIRKQYDWHFFHGKTLSDLPDVPRAIINATDVALASSFKFSKDRAWGFAYRDYHTGTDSFTGINFPISLAVMASSCVPFAFNPIRMPEKFRRNKVNKLPLLVDGGLYDNQGVHEISEQSSEHYFTKYAIVSNAGNTDLNDKKIWNIVKLLIKTSDILMKRIEKLQSRKIMFSSSNVESRFAYLSLTWDATDRLVRGFVWNIAKGLVPAEVYQEHGIEEEEAESMRKHYHASKGYKSDDVERLMQKVKNSIGWDSLEHLRPNEKEVIIARNVCTGLDGLSKKKVYCLQKFSEWMTIVQVRMYLPNLLN